MNETFNLPAEEAAAVVGRWKGLYARKAEMQARRASEQFLWHAFSYGVVPSISGPDAMRAYENAARGIVDFVVIHGESRQRCAGRLHGHAPTFHGRDVIVAPLDFGWTIAFTHEEPSLGPYFAHRPIRSAEAP